MQTTSNKEIHKGYILTSLGKIHYWTIGKGETILLIHQSTSSAEEYAGLIPYLAGKYQLISYDWPGHGNSDDPEEEPTVEEYTQSAISVLDHLKIEKCHVLGHHGGAVVAMNLSYLQPGRISKLMLSGTSGPKNKAEAKEFTRSLEIKKRHQLELDGQSLLEAWKRYVNYLPESPSEEILRPFLNNIQSRLRPYDAHYAILRWDRKPALHSLNGPVLLIQGANDTFVSRQEKLLDIIPKSERVVVPKAGPFMFFEMPGKSAEILRNFLEKTH